ncbi:hypothetical protein M501DRAFT_925891 [Patellaria atrata CBS 101060]|uniref:WD40 repeat-like protein n=1 Tax=Patellaria atrata CBS 101060 TaxID=1346257 RepID=A0A9P4SKS3_9PEZI|nr:hypothetical protein M501DRAFT_925891 [Patellaria atrata CBS 101060]
MSARRSGRQRHAAKRYSIDAFEGLKDVLGSSDSDEDAPTQEGEESEDEYSLNGNEDIGNEEENELSLDEGSGDNASAEEHGEYDEGGDKYDDNDSIIGPDTYLTEKGRKSTHKAGKRRINRAQKGDYYHVRGISELKRHQGKDNRILYTYGGVDEDVIPFLMARDKWFNQVILPARKHDKYGTGGLAYSFYFTEKMREKELSLDTSGLRSALYSNQKQGSLSPSEALQYLPHPRFPHINFLFGSTRKPVFQNLAIYHSIPLASGWPQTEKADKTTPISKPKSKPGWLFNVGGKPQCINWLPNHNVSKQYLAVAIFTDAAPLDPQVARAFIPTVPSPASIQIWSFNLLEIEGEPRSFDDSVSPRLEAVICTDWGPIKEFQWCPTLRNVHGNEESIHLGILAGVWGDGKLRILNIDLPTRNQAPDTAPQNIHITSAAFESQAPESIFTCLTWLSYNHIAAGCANGSVAVWDLTATFSGYSRSWPSNPKPWFYQNLHDTFILKIESGYPSRPHLICTSSMDGFLRLTDIRSPTADSLFGGRNRLANICLSWQDITQSFISADDTYMLRMYPLRRFFSTLGAGRLDSNATSVATSLLHPGVLTACLDGTVIALNSLRKPIDLKSDVWQLVWFAHEYRPGKGAWTVKNDGVEPSAQENGRSPQNGSTMDTLPNPLVNGQQQPSFSRELLLGQPMCRITEGFKLETKHFSSGNTAARSKEGEIYTTIHELESAVTQVCWNPNPICGGWAAAAMGSGLVRVEDLAI